ncbi:MAG: hypothetical protein IIZ06_07505 [Kiritimatiellae bacterium]|nr:hypothetical protein [Kiritimatiellia bacterium]
MTTYYTYDSTTKRLTRAPDPAIIDGRMIVHPTAAMYASINAYPLGDTTPPTPPEGKIVVQDGYELDFGEWRPHWVFDDAPPPPPRVFSKLKIVAALTTAGVWAQAKEYIETAGLYDLYLAAQDFAEDNPYFAQGRAALQTALGWTDEQVEAVLAAAVI